MLAKARPFIFAALMSGGMTLPALALDEDAQIKLGEMEYMTSCASCHGPKGIGDGPVAEVLTQKPSDLTRIAENLGGTFPRDEVYRVIDGRKMITVHGDRMMPVWGYRYLSRAIERSQEVPHDVDVQAMVLGRITALVLYLESMQVD